MGYINTANTTTLTAKLTPIGRKKLVLTNNNLVQSFGLGDSDSNYYAALPLTTGQVPSDTGNIGPYASISNSVGQNVSIKSLLRVNSTGITQKTVESQSSDVVIETVQNGQVVISGTDISQVSVNRNNQNTDSLVNLFYSFNLPLNSNDDYKFTGLTSAYGGFSDTALSGIDQTDIVVIGINSDTYGETIDGKSIKLDITTFLGSYSIYSTFQNTGQALSVLDASYNDSAANTMFVGDNIAFLFCDDIQQPNNDSTLSWATGYNTVKPFNVNGKQLYNFTTDTNVNENADTIVGIVYLDKGFIVLTHPTLVNFFDITSTATTVTLDSISMTVTQNITCIANRGEFGTSTNTTYRAADIPRISEVGLYDIDNDLIAIAKTDRHLIKNVNEFLALNIKLSV